MNSITLSSGNPIIRHTHLMGCAGYACEIPEHVCKPAPDALRAAAQAVMDRFLDTPASLAAVHVHALAALRAALEGRTA